MPAATGAPTNEAPPQVQAILDACSHGATPGRGGWILRRRTTSPLETRFITR
jgi:hypothetical protein